jgi:lysine 2,3-aminomutase
MAILENGGHDLAGRRPKDPKAAAAAGPHTPRDSQAHERAVELAHLGDKPFVNLRDPAQALGPDGKPAVSRRAPIWADVTDEKWNDWRWQLSNRVNTVDEIGRILNLTDDEKAGLSSPDKFRVDITPYFISLIDPNDPNDPIRRQVIPTDCEHEAFTAMMEDSLAEDRHSPVPGLVHRYPDRVLMLVTTQCASYCRYCTRSRIVGDPAQNFNRAEHEAQLEYIRRTPQIRDVLISGGDGLTLAPKLLESVLRGLREIPHVEIIRIGSRVPVFMPQRVTDELCDMLAKYHPLWMNLHFNHPNELTPEVARACDRLSRAGIPLGNQSVLLAGVNDCVNIQRALVQKLVEFRVRPYYLYQCDLVEGSGHFRTPVGKGIEIMEGLRGHTSGYAVPTYMIDAPGGGGKIPVMPNYLISYSDHKVVLRNYEGYITTYEEPMHYQPHDSAHCAYCQHPRPEPGQAGVTGLLEGEGLWIEPSGFEETHRRGVTGPHRLQDPGKWVPYGVGPIEGTAGKPMDALGPGSGVKAPEVPGKPTMRDRGGSESRSERTPRSVGEDHSDNEGIARPRSRHTVAGGEHGAPVPESSGAAGGHTEGSGPSGDDSRPKEPDFVYGPGEEPRPPEGRPTGWHKGDLL